MAGEAVECDDAPVVVGRDGLRPAMIPTTGRPVRASRSSGYAARGPSSRSTAITSPPTATTPVGPFVSSRLTPLGRPRRDRGFPARRPCRPWSAIRRGRARAAHARSCARPPLPDASSRCVREAHPTPRPGSPPPRPGRPQRPVEIRHPPRQSQSATGARARKKRGQHDAAPPVTAWRVRNAPMRRHRPSCRCGSTCPRHRPTSPPIYQASHEPQVRSLLRCMDSSSQRVTAASSPMEERRGLRSRCGRDLDVVLGERGGSVGRALAPPPMEALAADAHRAARLGARPRLPRGTRPANRRGAPCGARSLEASRCA